MNSPLSVLLVLALLAGSLSSAAHATDRRAFKEIPIEDLIDDTQVQPPGGIDGVNLIWWMPNVFWQASIAQDPTAGAEAQDMLKNLEGISIVAICQALVSDSGAFDFYTEEEISRGLIFTYLNAAGEEVTLTPIEEPSMEVQTLLAVMRPMFTNVIGQLGANLHFFVYDTTVTGQELDPYESGELRFTLTNRQGEKQKAVFETPLNSIYEPRLCPNGKPAHITWVYCPWTGKKLDEVAIASPAGNEASNEPADEG